MKRASKQMTQVVPEHVAQSETFLTKYPRVFQFLSN